MVTRNNRYYHGYCRNNGNPRSSVNYYIIETVREISDYEGGTIIETINNMEDFYFDEQRIGNPFYAIYAILKEGSAKASILISTKYSLDDAIYLVQSLSGNYMIETEQPVYRIPDKDEE